MRHITDSQRLIVVFERPSDWLNVLSQTFWLGTDICHAKLLFTHQGNWWLTELTYSGVLTYKIEPDNEWYIIENACEAFAFDTVTSFSYDSLQYSKFINKLGLVWSNWYAVHAILNGKFPSLNCVSYISFLLFGTPKYDLPDKLREVFLNVNH